MLRPPAAPAACHTPLLCDDNSKRRSLPCLTVAAAGFHGEVADLELPADVARRLQKEAGVMSGLRHPHLVTFLGLCTMPPCILTGASVTSTPAWVAHCLSPCCWLSSRPPGHPKGACWSEGVP